jgi:hypothetical protein
MPSSSSRRHPLTWLPSSVQQNICVTLQEGEAARYKVAAFLACQQPAATTAYQCPSHAWDEFGRNAVVWASGAAGEDGKLQAGRQAHGALLCAGLVPERDGAGCYSGVKACCHGGSYLDTVAS